MAKKKLRHSTNKLRDERKTPNSGYPEIQGKGNKIKGFPNRKKKKN